MGNKISRRRDTQKGAEAAAAAEDPVQPAEEPEVPQTQEAAEEEDLDVVVGDPVAVVACLPSEECTSEMKQPKGPAAALAAENDVEPQPVPTEAPAPAQAELLQPSPKPEPVAAAQLAPQPELTSNLQPEAEVVCEPTPEPVPGPAEHPEQQTDTFTQETLPEPVLSSPTLVDLAVPDVTLQPVITPLSQAPIPSPANADEPSDVPLTEEDQGGAQPGGTSDSPNEPEEAAENALAGDVTEDSVSTLLKNLELQGNDLVADLIPYDVKMPEETPSADVCSSTELM